MARLVTVIVVAAVAAFCVVQDRVTARGATEYVAIQREAIAGHRPPTTIDGIMQPAVRQSVSRGLMSSAAVAAVGAVVGYSAWRRRRA